jgi:hypothetical protein
MKKANLWLGVAVAATLIGLAAGDALAQGYDRANGAGNGGNWGFGAGGQYQMNLDPAQVRQQMLDNFRELLKVSNDEEWALVQALIQKVLDISASIDSKPLPEAAVLQQAVNAKASLVEIETALKQYLAARQARQEALLQAQETLRKVLTVRQEAIATNNGLLP